MLGAGTQHPATSTQYPVTNNKKMIRNYFKIALRNIRRYPAHSIINISGMAIAMACAIIILLWVQHEMNWDRFYPNANELYRVIVNHQYKDGPLQQEVFAPVPLAAALKEEYPEILRASRYENIGTSLRKGDDLLSEKISFVDPDFLKMFHIELIQGDINTAFTGPYNLIISEEMAHKFFADEDPVGKTLTYKDIVLTVTGVAKNLPHNSQARFGFLAPFESLLRPEMQIGIKNDWIYPMGSCLIELNKGTDGRIVEDKIKNIIKRNNKDINAEISLQNFKKIHLYSARKYFGESFYIGNIIYVQLGSLIALLILIIACINYINLVTAQSARRAKEIGIRKVAGADKRKIMFQFLGESLLIVFVAHIIAMILVELLLPGFNSILYRGITDIEVNYKSVSLYMGLIAVVLFCGLLAGSYPALYLSSLKPSHILKGISDKNTGNAKFRRILVISQFTMSFLFILCTFIIRSQLNYMQNRNLGLNMYNTAHFEFTYGIQRETLKNKLLNNPHIESVTITGHQNVLSNWASVSGLSWSEKKAGDDILFHILLTDKDFAKTFQLELKEGRFLTSDEYAEDIQDQFINIVINEKAATLLGFKEPLGEVLLSSPGWKLRIVGIVKDFHFKQLRYAIDPLIILPIRTSLIGGNCYIRIQPGHTASAINDIRSLFKTLNVDYAPDVVFPDDDYDQMYMIEQKANTLFGIISIMAIIISCLGLIGLSTFMTLRRTKEIGIRKTNGAKSIEIFFLLSKEYIKLVMISFIISCPIALYATNIWLRSFVYRTHVGWWVFVLAWIIVMVITLLTVGFQTYRAASKNPVEALRYE